MSLGKPPVVFILASVLLSALVIAGVWHEMRLRRLESIFAFPVPEPGWGRTSVLSRAEAQMDIISQSVERYYLRQRKLPTSLDQLTERDPRTGEPLMESIPDDPWGHPYEFNLLGNKKFQVVSVGEDGQEGTGDDVVWPPEDR